MTPHETGSTTTPRTSETEFVESGHLSLLIVLRLELCWWNVPERPQAPFVGPEKGLVYAPHRSRRCEDVVDPPSDVPLARAAPLPPPRVLARLLGMQGAKTAGAVPPPPPDHEALFHADPLRRVPSFF